MVKPFKPKARATPSLATKSPADFDLCTLESRAAARAMAERRKHCGIRLLMFYIGTDRPPEKQPKPKYRNGWFEEYFADDDDWPEGKRI
jgi:hypothetical protein